jgi:hypothetical protein
MGGSGKTAIDLVETGHPELMTEYVDSIDAGVYA